MAGLLAPVGRVVDSSTTHGNLQQCPDGRIIGHNPARAGFTISPRHARRACSGLIHKAASVTPFAVCRPLGDRRMEFRLFGEVQLWVAGEPLDIGTPRQQAVLAALAIDAGRPVSIETLVSRVWGEDPPAQARNVLYSHLSRIRQLFKQAGDIRVTRRNAGYVLQVDPDAV